MKSLNPPLCRILAAWSLFFAAFTQAQTSVQIHDIMVAGNNPVVGTAATKTLPYSPYYGQTVSVSGIVVGVIGTGDFAGAVYISEPSSSWDSLVLTAEGMPVFNLTALNSACAVVGNTITVIGQVVLSNSVVATDITAAATPGTGIAPTSCTVNSTGGTMTQSISLGTTLNSFGGALEYTGMTTTATFYAVAPATGTLIESTETETSNGQFWATLSANTGTNNHLFRSAGIAGDEYVPTGAPTTVATWAGNPQRILIDTTTFGGTAVNITVGQSISCTTGANIKVGATAGIGLIDYTLGYARLLIFPTSVCTVGGTVATTTSAAADSTHFKVGTLDLNRFYSTTGATNGSVAIASNGYATRLAKAAQAIVNSLGKPDIISLQEVQDLPTLTDLANAVNTLGTVTYNPYLAQGNDANSLNVGFLVNSTTLVTDSVTQVEKGSTYTTPAGASATLWERPPLVLQAEFVRLGKNYPVTVLDVHLTPRDNSGDPTLGAGIRAHRAAQAADLSALVQAYQAAGDNVIVAGNLNAFEYSDGYVDVTGIIDGAPAAATAVTLYKPTSTTSPLTDFATSVAATSRYNFIERGDAVTYEHILASATVTNNATASASLASYESSVTQPHFTTDFAAINANSSATPAGLTPHDGFVVAFLIPPVPTTASISATSVNFGNVDLGANSTITLTVTNTTTFISTVNVTSIAISGTNGGDYTQTSNCTSLSQNQSCTITLVFAPTATGTRTGLLTVKTDSTSDPTLTTTLTGVGLDTTATLTPITATFPSTDIGATSTSQTFTFTNTSVGVTLAKPTVTISSDYAITVNTCTTTLAPSGTCTISVDFSPTAAGTRTGTLTVTNSSTGNPVLTSILTGTGLDTTATLLPAAVTFASTDVTGTSASQIVTFTNTSTIAVTISKTTITGDFTQTATICGTSVAAGVSCTYTLVFSPTVVGTRTGTFSVMNSTTGDPTLSVTLNGTGLDTTATISPTTATFASTDITGTSATQTFTVTNTSTVSITLTKIALTGDFAQTATTCGTTLAASGTCTITIDFAPTATGTRTGTLTVTNSTTANPILVATLTGTGLDTTATLTPTTQDFGSIYAGGGLSTARTFTLTNTSAVSIAPKLVSLAGNFTQTNNCTATLTAAASCTISVIFAPLTSGALTGTLTVTDTSTGNPTLTATLTGTGLPTTASFAPTSAAYGNVIVGVTSAAQTFTWTNTSAIPLTISRVVTTGDYAVSATSCSGLIAANSSCSVSVTFTPTALYARTGTVTVTSTSSANGTLTAALSGTGVADVEASVTALNFGNVDIGYSAPTQTFTITNYTNASISFTGIAITGDYAYTTTCGATIAGLATCTVTVKFTPTALGPRTGTLIFNTNDTKYPVITIALTGNGVDFSIAVAPTSDSTIAGYTVTPNITLTPLGGYSGVVAIGCTTTATGSTCTPQTANPTLSATIMMPLTITTTSQYTVIGYSGFPRPILALLAALSAIALYRKRRSTTVLRIAGCIALLILLTAANLGCGSQDPNRNANPTYPGTYTYTISATDGTLTHTAAYTLSVAIRY